eukprot:CAMPEP_0113297956 /NCGR_PEP_ID=MMETSP0010_2-20120614/599_1 /TAXON_ID=216773 ORGANISM="Corethron hystrix, Strain 308" /NCGR_SAMPLE_ID=MMETSP0010_2 /ASSEMBLY_ACC=CAM_ASM_000155 /LENGTH=165 /DNA_ID=CAMNT_0000150925 /DNA_START=30 /DNA_END=527 /DNA_ORIENTATION=+ /assembly_acc=CAM_ASM_000155
MKSFGEKNLLHLAFIALFFLATTNPFVRSDGCPPGTVHTDEGTCDNIDLQFQTSSTGLKYRTIKDGSGPTPQTGQKVSAHYSGWLDAFDTGKKFDSSRDRGKPFQFNVGAGKVIKGWDESFATMQVGERRQIIVPPELGYGSRGAGGIIPGGATLYFDVQLLELL